MQRYDGRPEREITSYRNWPPKGPINVCWTEQKEKYFKVIKYKKFPPEELKKKRRITIKQHSWSENVLSTVFINQGHWCICKD